MARNQAPGQSEKPRHAAERDAAQPIAGQPREDGEELQQPENVPSFFSAREFQARGPAKAVPAGGAATAADDGEEDDADEAPKRGSAKKR
jgi:hypothetical protein